MKLFLVRHGETDWLLEGRLQGRSGVQLNDTGKKQALAAAGYLKGEKASRLYASELLRAKETARFISAECSILPQEDARLNEIFFGDWEGKPHQEIQSQYPELYRGWVDLDAQFSAPGGENVQVVLDRIRAFFAEARHFQEPVIAVSHGGPIRLLLLELLGEPLHKFRSLPIEPGSVTLVENRSEYFEITKIQVETGDGTPIRSFLTGETLDAR